MINSPLFKRTLALGTVTWDTTVPYDDAVLLCSTDWNGENGREYLDGLAAAQCDSRKAGAWAANDRKGYVVYRSAAIHKRAQANA